MRGKYKARAMNRDEQRTADQVREDQARTIRKLEAEKAALVAKNEAQAETHRREMTRITADLHAGVEPRLKAARDLNAELKDALGKLRETNINLRNLWDRALEMMLDHFHNVDGMTRHEALEEAGRLLDRTTIGDETGEMWRKRVLVEDAVQLKLGRDGVEAVQRARGLRA